MSPSPTPLIGHNVHAFRHHEFLIVPSNFLDRLQRLTTTLSPQHPLPNSQASDRRKPSPPMLTFTSLTKRRSTSEKSLPGPGTSPNIPVSWWKQALRPLPMSGLGNYPKSRSLAVALTVNFPKIHQRNTEN